MVPTNDVLYTPSDNDGIMAETAPSLANASHGLGGQAIISKESLLHAGMAMVDMIKVTSKGQITLPIGIRNSAGITDESYLLVEQVGDYILLKKAELRMREIMEKFGSEAKRKKITRKALIRELLRTRKELWTE
jgi:antitoxin PrlF